MADPASALWVCGCPSDLTEAACAWLVDARYPFERLVSVQDAIGRIAQGGSEVLVLVEGTEEEVAHLVGADPTLAIVVLLPEIGVPAAVRIMQAGARAVASARDQVLAHIRELITAIRPEVVRPRWTESERAIFTRIVNRSPAMGSVVERIRSVTRAPDTTVLILGESGTGKELVARAVHALSARAPHPYIAVDCGAIPEALFESELFGYDRGAFSGAVADRKGRFELAHGGTLFLDEIGELPMAMQAKLLRVLEERLVWRVGARAPRPVDVRLVAATHRDLRSRVDRGQFRADLFFRLNVFTIQLPPLRERGADVLHLALHFFERFNRDMGRELRGIAVGARAKLVAYEYPGNVRELQNVIEAAVIAAPGPWIEAADIALADVATAAAPTSPDEIALRLTFGEGAFENLERAAIQAALARAGGNQTRAAQLLGIQRLALARAAVRLGIPIGARARVRP
jgi:transcriptional regulator with GAF, ATPase, and Fis domain